MKVYIQNRENPISLQTKRVLRDTLITKGHEVVLNKAQADRIFVEINVGSTLPKKADAKIVFYRSKNGRPVIVEAVKGNDKQMKLLREVKTKGFKINYSSEQISSQQRNIVDYLLGRVDSVDVLDPFPLNAIEDIIEIYLNAKRESGVSVAKLEKLKAKYSLNDIDVEVLSDEVYKATVIDDSSKLIQMVSTAEYIFTDYFGKGIFIPFVSYSILSNLLKAYKFLDIARITSKEDVRANKTKQAIKEIDELKKTIRLSMFNKNSWKTYGKKELGGVYGIFIPDNDLKDCQIKVPRPRFGNFKSIVGGVEIAVLKKFKAVLSTAKNEEVADHARRLGYRLLIVNNIDEKLKGLRLYPKIGDKIVVTRHPITTLLIEAEVVGYTADASIRVNNKMIQALEGDADGDSLSIAWGHPVDLKFVDKMQLDEYVKIAKINLEIEERDNLYKIDNSIKEIDKAKSEKTAEEQATAKLVTANMTGSFGVAERTFILSCIVSNMKVDLETVYTRSRMSQLSVQAKNILAELKEGKLSTETIETFKTYFLVMEDKFNAKATLAAFLDVELEKVDDILGLGEKLEIVEQEDSDILKIF